MFAPRKVPSEVEAQFVSDYVGGLSHARIAKKYGWSPSTVRNVLRRQAVPMRSAGKPPRPYRKLTADQEVRIVRDYLEGLPLDRVGIKNEVAYATVRGVLLRRGVPIRPKGLPAKSLGPTKRCSSCGLDLPCKTAFYNEGKRTSECKVCLSIKAGERYANDPKYRAKKVLAASEWQRKHPQESQAKKRRWASGWTQEQFEVAWVAQEGRCSICQVLLLKYGSSSNSVCADHDHETGKARGLICNQCNKHLGIHEKYRYVFDLYLAKYRGTEAL